jgi:hypothetical protein
VPDTRDGAVSSLRCEIELCENHFDRRLECELPAATDLASFSRSNSVRIPESLSNLSAGANSFDLDRPAADGIYWFPGISPKNFSTASLRPTSLA